MKIFKYFSLAMGLLLAVTSCDDNEPTSFTSDMAHVAFSSSTAKVNEDGESIQIPITLAALPGALSVTVNLTVSSEGSALPAVEGEDFTVDTKTLTFSEPGTQYVTITPIDNDEFAGGTKTFTISIASVSPELLKSVQNSISVSIIDDDHPLSAIIGQYVLSCTSNYDGPIEFEVAISASEEDTYILMMDLGYGTFPVKVQEVDGEYQLTIAAAQNIGKYSKYDVIAYCAFIEGDKIKYSTTQAHSATFDHGVITFEEGMYIAAVEDGTVAGALDLFLPGTIVLTKK
ncbi:hypothetical protein NXV86_10455 [Bacteroides sp. BFG-257]|uniref:Calx-beta domain-containing protein n=1 Tax=Bacteroides TaxID=816 RepID=UPI001CCC61A7|nr:MULTISPECIES: Calx-beta domain-containing protein [Bacteroides]UBD71697.1 hypothetical protein K6V21_09955 [Bacteroides cellulosilyticus]UBD71707.1 hypothetical protein K6V21_10005 [Bacteroides cellulosilyticus]UVP00318.1 hypothetical protein NXV86_10455 [Bacteroides sp. BFG-257]